MPTKSLGTLTLDLVARTAGFTRGMDKAERESAKWRRKVKKNIDDTTRSLKIMSAAAAGGAVAAFAAVTKASIRQENAFRQIEQRLISTEGAVGRTAEELDGLAAALQKTTTFGDEAINEMQGMLLTFTDIRGEVYERTLPAILDLSVAMNQDLKSSAVQLGKALNDPIAKLSALSRTGIHFSEDQKETIKTLVEMGDKTAAQNIILQELERQFGGAAKAAADTFGGALEQVKNAFGDLLENPAGLEANKEALQELTNVLQEPATVAAAQELTGGLIEGFAAVFGYVRDTVNALGFLKDEVLQIFGIIESNDIARQQEELAAVRERLYGDSAYGKFFRFAATEERIAELQAKEIELQNQIAAGYERINNAAAGVLTPIKTQRTRINRTFDAPAANDGAAAAAGAASPVSESAEPARGASLQEGGNRFTVIEEEHQQHADNIVAIETAKNAAIVDGTANLFGSLTGATKQFAGEQSDLYKVMFAIEKGAAIARSIIAIQTGIAQAAAAGPFPANLAAMASVASATASLVSTIASTSIQGQAHDGLMSVPKTGSYILEQGERVVSAETTKKMDKKLDGAGGAVNVNNYFDAQDVFDAGAGTVSGERAIMNIVTRNARTVRGLVA